MHPLLQVWDAIKPNALLENVTVDPVTREPVYTDKKKAAWAPPSSTSGRTRPAFR